MRVDTFSYDLDESLIAAEPASARDGARLLVALGEERADRQVVDLPGLLPEGALVLVNDTRVVPARLLGQKRGSGGRAEIFLVRRDDGPADESGERWLALGRASKALKPGSIVDVGPIAAEVLEKRDDGTLLVRLTTGASSLREALEAHGHMPLPPYIRRPDQASDRTRYQTVFAKHDGAVAAPTAGLHLTEALLGKMAARGMEIAPVTLHVGLGTFQPVTVADLDDHPMHTERYVIEASTAQAIEAARAARRPVVAIGTTVVRAVESAASEGPVRAGGGETRLLIQPGYTFRVVDLLLTNFHLPQSTLLALVCAFGGQERVLDLYAHATAARYRFFSYGDAMLIDRRPAR